MRNLMRTLIVLIFANLIFMAGLEIQRRTIWNQEAEYLRKMEAFIISNEKSEESYRYIQRLLEDIQIRANAVQFATRENDVVNAQIKDIRERVVRIEGILAQHQTVAPTVQGSSPQ